MSILQSIFGGSNQQQQQQQANQAPQQQATPVEQEAPAPEGLDKYTELVNYQPDPDKVPKPFDPADLISADPEALAKQVSQMNFVQGAISKEEAELIAQGGEGALGVMAKALNTVAQNAFMHAVTASKNISSETLKQSLSHLDSRVDSRLKSQQVNSALAQANPILAHPAAKPMIEAIMPKIQAKHPEASPEEIRDKAVEYLTDFANAVNPPQTDDSTNSKVPAGTNWNEWIGDEL